MGDTVDFGRNPAAPQFGRFGLLAVRYGKAVRGQPPRRRSVCSVMGWAVEAVADYVANIRPRLGLADHPALRVTERGGRLHAADLAARFDVYRAALGLPPALGLRCLRHAYVTHLIEDGWDALFVQQQVGHDYASTTGLYTCVSSDYRTRTLRRALDQTITGALGAGPANAGAGSNSSRRA